MGSPWNTCEFTKMEEASRGSAEGYLLLSFSSSSFEMLIFEIRRTRMEKKEITSCNATSKRIDSSWKL